MAAKTEKKGGIVELLKTIIYALLIAGVIRTLIFQPFWIPSGSMKPTLLIGDFLFVNKFAYGYSQYSCPTIRGINLCGFLGDMDERILSSDPERGDVIVFRHPVSGEDYIKRLIGLPGDRIQMQNGQIILNGTPVPQADDGVFAEPYEQQGPQRRLPLCSNAPVGIGGTCEKQLLQETLPNDVVHPILNVRNSPGGDSTREFQVPDGHYFMMGDNRDNSVDSRFSPVANGVGMVPAVNLIGRADRIIFSSAGRSLFFVWTWRSDRFFRAVN